MNITIFYSWQSDTEFNRKSIRDALLLAKIEVEKKVDGLHIKVDEATSNEVGTLHIPNAILRNISKADIFIGDLTIIGKAYSSEKQLANPNVLIELGYAISELNWNRIIILFNKNFGQFPNSLPFDIEKRSVVDLSITSQNDTNGIGQLKVELAKRILDMIEKNPQRNLQTRTQAETKQRSEDIKTISSVFDLFRIKRMDALFKHGYSRIDGKIKRKIERLNEILNSKLFFMFDQELRDRLLSFRKSLLEIEELLKGYAKANSSNYYENKVIKNGHDPKRFDPAKSVINQIDQAFTNLLDYVKQNYHEIEMNYFFEYEEDA